MMNLAEQTSSALAAAGRAPSSIQYATDGASSATGEAFMAAAAGVPAGAASPSLRVVMRDGCQLVRVGASWLLVPSAAKIPPFGDLALDGGARAAVEAHGPFRVEEVAEIFGMTRQGVYRRIRAGELRTVPVTAKTSAVEPASLAAALDARGMWDRAASWLGC